MALKGTILAIVFTIIEVLVLAFTVIGTPIAQFKPRHRGPGVKSCLTMWGAKADCGSTSYSARGIDAFGCGQRKNNMTGAAVFAIVSIVVALILVLYGVLMVLNACQSAILPIILSILAVATLLVCWACVAGVYNNSMCNCNGCWMSGKLKNMNIEYGAGFILIVIAWCLQVVNCILAFVMMFL